MKRVLKIVGSLFLVLLIGGVIYLFPKIQRVRPFFKIQGQAVKAGDRLGDLALIDAQGEGFRLSDYKGKVVLINFFASW